MKNKIWILAATLLTAPLLSGCVGAAIGAGATLGVAAAQEGGLQGAATDTAIRVQVMDAWFKHDAQLVSKLSLTVREGRALITGSVPNPDLRVDAIRLVWQVDGVRQVINEIRVDNGSNFQGYVTDSWITGNLKTQLLLDKSVQSINYTIETVSGTVYLMGIAQDQKELDHVINYARNTKYVKNVVSYVRLRGEIPVGVADTATVSNPAPVSNGNAYSSDNSNASYGGDPVTAAPLNNEPITRETLSAPGYN